MFERSRRHLSVSWRPAVGGVSDGRVPQHGGQSRSGLRAWRPRATFEPPFGCRALFRRAHADFSKLAEGRHTGAPRDAQAGSSGAAAVRQRAPPRAPAHAHAAVVAEPPLGCACGWAHTPQPVPCDAARHTHAHHVAGQPGLGRVWACVKARQVYTARAKAPLTVHATLIRTCLRRSRALLVVGGTDASIGLLPATMPVNCYMDARR